MRVLTGKAIAIIDSTEYPVNVFLDLQRGCCVLFERDTDQAPVQLKMMLAFAKQIFLKDVEITSSQGTLQAEKIGPFFFSSHRDIQFGGNENKTIPSSTLATLLDIESDATEPDELIITPRLSELRFELRGSLQQDDSEGLFHCEPRQGFDFTIKLGNGDVRVHTFDSERPLFQYIRCVSSNLTLSEYTTELRIAISLFLRRRSFFPFIRDGKSIRIHLATPDNALSYGFLIWNPTKYPEALQKLAAYAPHRQLYFLIEAFSNPGVLEVRLLNAFVHLEIIDRSRTLSANQLAAVLGISNPNAEAIVRLRNEMIHHGLDLKHALEECRRRTASIKGHQLKAQILDDVFKTDSPYGNFYAALMDCLSIHLAKEAQIPVDWVARKVALSFQ
jgi:hypothetical protein